MADYTTLDEVKSELSIIEENYDDMLQSMIEQAKELIDDRCNRQFDTIAETRYFDGVGSPLFIDDLASISGGSDGIFLDEDGDGTYDATAMTENTDYVLYPLNGYPKIMVKISSNSNYGGFANGVKRGVKIVATWGYSTTLHKTVRRASIIQVCRWFKRRESAFADVIGTTEFGQLIMYKGIDPDIALILEPLRKKVL